VVETIETIDSQGRHSQRSIELPMGILNVVSRHVYNQEMIVRAGLQGDRRLALQVLVNDPLVTELESAGEMLDEMLVANWEYLPQFA
jgi:alpha-galactosidase